MSAPLLVHLPYSPWSERARWALDLRGVPYRSEHYQPLIGELRLRRLRAGSPGPASVPILVTVDGVLADSTDIARFADAQGGVGPVLFPPGREAEIARWGAVADRALDAGRALALRRALARPEALSELVPPSLRWLGPVARAIAARGVKLTLRKYRSGTSDVVQRAQLATALEELRSGLADAPPGEPKTLLGTLSFADVTAAQALAFVSPAGSGIRVGPGNRGAFTDPELAERFADLLAWRDALYAAFR